ncbi:Lrp/AsnC family transcriptional regulator [Sandaracinobacter neustonicus]|uniref:Lrp/AsnC family transcriptional regulator n=1 Tax=Sandaracinobacter neustonicus TaxID=1715348 RepID=A0A501XGT0_9SPHN|nr:Lrp/AsnC family transcriptional regulator [Sandaracinobacter neustonicus]TPE59517.1 Lrp/AsnC family transcriptional regulator [Sandaracinobacter neustonicus]
MSGVSRQNISIPPAQGRRRTAIALDSIDIEILRQLQNDGRISKSELAERVNLSKSACLERMRALERNKIIISYHAKIDVRSISPHEIFLTEVTLRSHRMHDFDRFERYISTVDSISECYALGGGIDYIMKVIAKDVDQYQNLIEKLLSADIGIEKYFTYISTKVVKSSGSTPIHAILAEDRMASLAEKAAEKSDI